MKIKFSEIGKSFRKACGVYEIFRNDGLPLKVGISSNLKKRLMQHKNSKQKFLKKKNEELPMIPNNVESKQSILAKHLFFDSEVTSDYDLTTEYGRQKFLENECYVMIKITINRNKALEIEKVLEAIGKYRYKGKTKEY